MIIGILGAGQLARMMALEGYPLGLEFIVLDPKSDACANTVAQQIQADYDDQEALAELARRTDLITYEFENVPSSSVRFLTEHAAGVPVYPPPRALAVAQDRLEEKRLFQALNINTAPFAAIESLAALREAMTSIGWPAVIKTRTQGYDGKGQAVLREPADLAQAWEQLNGVPAIVEAFIPFDREISVIAVRGRNGQIAGYPITENTHKAGVLRLSVVQQEDSAQPLALAYATALLEKLDYVGVLALELFQVGEELLANEFAPRVHNSGHWTQNGAQCSQFENHLRAIADLPLGQTQTNGQVAMVNLIGTPPSSKALLSHPHAHLHLYGKTARPGRKTGHINLQTDDPSAFDAELASLIALTNND